MMAYMGAYPAGRPTPDLRSVLVSGDSNFTFCFGLSIARDVNRDGNFQPVWDAVITRDLIAQLQQELPNRTFAASLGGGDNFPWQAPPDEAAWLKNAISSLSDLQTKYHLSGFDIDYEQGIDDPSFLRLMGQVVKGLNDYPNFPSRFHTPFYLAPFGATYQPYRQLYEDNLTYIALFNYQAYADGLEAQGVQGYLDKYAQLAQNNVNQGGSGYTHLGLGVCSSTQAPRGLQTPRGLQAPDIFTAWVTLHTRGSVCAIIWCLEDSVLNNYEIERQLQARS